MALVYVIIALGVASVWSFFRWRHGKERFFSWVDTLLSVVLGFAVALLMYSIEREGDSAERRSQLRDLLAVELTHFVQSMEEGYRLEVDLPVDSGTRAPRDSVVLDITQIQPLISEEAAASGLFDDASSIRLLTLSTEAR